MAETNQASQTGIWLRMLSDPTMRWTCLTPLGLLLLLGGLAVALYWPGPWTVWLVRICLLASLGLQGVMLRASWRTLRHVRNPLARTPEQDAKVLRETALLLTTNVLIVAYIVAFIPLASVVDQWLQLLNMALIYLCAPLLLWVTVAGVQSQREFLRTHALEYAASRRIKFDFDIFLLSQIFLPYNLLQSATGPVFVQQFAAISIATAVLAALCKIFYWRWTPLDGGATALTSEQLQVLQEDSELASRNLYIPITRAITCILFGFIFTVITRAQDNTRQLVLILLMVTALILLFVMLGTSQTHRILLLRGWSRTLFEMLAAVAFGVYIAYLASMAWAHPAPLLRASWGDAALSADGAYVMLSQHGSGIQLRNPESGSVEDFIPFFGTTFQYAVANDRSWILVDRIFFSELFAGDGTLLAKLGNGLVVVNADQTALLARADDHTELRALPAGTPLRRFDVKGEPVALSSNGKLALIGTTLYNSATGESLRTLPSEIKAAAFSPDGATLIALVEDRIVQIPLNGGQVLAAIALTEYSNSINPKLYYAPDGQRILVAWRNLVTVLDLRRGVQHAFRGVDQITDARFSGDAVLIATNHGVWRWVP